MWPVIDYEPSPFSQPEKVKPSAALNYAATATAIEAPVNDNWIKHRSMEPEIHGVTPRGSIEERLFDATAQAKQWCSRVGMHLDRNIRKRIFLQLDVLHDADEWCDGDQPVSLPSFQSFVRAIIYHQIGSPPALSLAPDGHVFAQWNHDGDLLTVEFLSENKARYLVRSKSWKGPEKAAGVVPLERLTEILSPFDGQRWFNAG